MMSGSLAMSPSMLNTPSVTTKMRRAPFTSVELGFQVVHVGVLVDQPLRLGATAAVDQRGVVERVGHQRVLFARDRGDQPGVGRPARHIGQRAFAMRQLGERLFDLARGSRRCRR